MRFISCRTGAKNVYYKTGFMLLHHMSSAILLLLLLLQSSSDQIRRSLDLDTAAACNPRHPCLAHNTVSHFTWGWFSCEGIDQMEGDDTKKPQPRPYADMTDDCAELPSLNGLKCKSRSWVLMFDLTLLTISFDSSTPLQHPDHSWNYNVPSLSVQGVQLICCQTEITEASSMKNVRTAK